MIRLLKVSFFKELKATAAAALCCYLMSCEKHQSLSPSLPPSLPTLLLLSVHPSFPPSFHIILYTPLSNYPFPFTSQLSTHTFSLLHLHFPPFSLFFLYFSPSASLCHSFFATPFCPSFPTNTLSPNYTPPSTLLSPSSLYPVSPSLFLHPSFQSSFSFHTSLHPLSTTLWFHPFLFILPQLSLSLRLPFYPFCAAPLSVLRVFLIPNPSISPSPSLLVLLSTPHIELQLYCPMLNDIIP